MSAFRRENRRRLPCFHRFVSGDGACADKYQRQRDIRCFAHACALNLVLWNVQKSQQSVPTPIHDSCTGKHTCAHKHTCTRMTCSFSFVMLCFVSVRPVCWACRVMVAHTHIEAELAGGGWIIHPRCLYALDRKRERWRRENKKWQQCKSEITCPWYIACYPAWGQGRAGRGRRDKDVLSTNRPSQWQNGPKTDTSSICFCVWSVFSVANSGVLHAGPQLDVGMAPSQIFLPLWCLLVHSSKSSFLCGWGRRETHSFPSENTKCSLDLCVLGKGNGSEFKLLQG